ncbi:hypothetical protein JZO70_19425 [Enterococcus sp. 669A]|uniref:Alanine dehydrogenase/pyridine nucleotide transhydrogenase NAD(H)-binding domain-containing protein n=1 Tax=Candidatus Enterococcus moelleringii TaxID=2815325 RepID=A0ABS3LI05_9ENTE|nr:hypothetical protein [Enterococcus sp. 669A]MBO1308356.1 hypothetical protein [Enterococcus sp. 669A]
MTISSNATQTATYALSNSTGKYVNLLANNPLKELLMENSALYHGVNTYHNKLVIEPVAADLEIEYTPLDQVW